MNLDRYLSVGLGFILFGVPLAAYSYLVLESVPYTSLGLACIILGSTIALVPENPIPTQTIRAMVEGACINIEALLEEVDVTSKAIYLPPRDDRGYAFIPIQNVEVDPWSVIDAPLRVFTEADGEPGIVVFPPGSEIVRLSLLDDESSLEEALNYVLVDFLESANSVKTVDTGDSIVVSIDRPRMKTDFARYEMVLGSLPTSIAGSVASKVLGKPVILLEEHESREQLISTFRVVDGPG